MTAASASSSVQGLRLRMWHRRRLPLIRQSEVAECALACLCMISHWFGRGISLNECREQGMIMPRGVSLITLRQAAAELGYRSRALRVSLGELRAFSVPVILHWQLNHFVVLVRASRRSLLIHDPALGRRRVSWQEADAAFSGVVLELSPAFALTRVRKPVRLRLLDFARNLKGFWRAVAQVAALSLLLQLVLLLTPLYSQLVVDDALRSGDVDLLAVLAGCFALLVVLRVLVQLLRGWLMVVIGTQLAHGAGVALQQRLLQLRFDWFERRATGDVLSRFRSYRPVTDMLAQGAALVVVDGLMALLALLLMFVYSQSLALLVLTSTGLFVLFRCALYPSFRAAALAQVASNARQESQLLESLRGISTIKAFGMEAQRSERWQRRYVDELNEGLRLARLRLGFSNVETALFGLELVLVIYFGAHSVLAGTLTVGMLFALLAYRSQFVARMTALVDGLINLKALDVHLERLADIVLADRATPELQSSPEPVTVPPSVAAERPRRIHLQGVSYRHGRYDADVFSDIDLLIEPGTMVVISGASGAGKTTLAKVAMGLLPPLTGTVTLGNAWLQSHTLRSYRRASAAVLQDDRLFAGSVLQNISLFADQPDAEHAERLLALLGLAHSITAMPMGLDTPVGELGGGLSGGQVQRLMLARALYARPAYLFLDECTAQLDPASAQRVRQLLRSLDMTRLIISHDPAFVALADRAYELTPQGLVAIRT